MQQTWSISEPYWNTSEVEAIEDADHNPYISEYAGMDYGVFNAGALSIMINVTLGIYADGVSLGPVG